MAKEEENSLFGGINLGEEFIEVPDNTQEVTQEKEQSIASAKTDDKSIEIDDLTFELHDEIKEAVKPAKVEHTNTQDKEKDSQVKKSTSSSPFKSFAKALGDEGILSSFDEEEFDKIVEELEGDEASALIELNRRTIEYEIESYKKESEDEYKAFLEARDAGVNLNDWAQVQDNKKRFAKITEDDLETNDKLQKQLVREDLLKRGFSEEDIVDTLESYEDTNKLGNMAKKALKNLKKFEDDREEYLKVAAIERDKEAAKENKKQMDSLKKQIEDTNEIIPGLKLNKVQKDEIMSSITQPVKTTEDGRQLNAVMVKRMEDPIKYAILEAYFVKQGFFDGKFDKLVAKSKSKATLELEENLTKDTSYKPGRTSLHSSGSDNVDTKEFELAFKNIKT